jgi:hypothetical protein
MKDPVPTPAPRVIPPSVIAARDASAEAAARPRRKLDCSEASTNRDAEKKAPPRGRRTS